ncbi:MAG: hypothetical protein ACYTKD_00925 [Planctomycetota bacterium]|jgi:hypothetical protein
MSSVVVLDLLAVAAILAAVAYAARISSAYVGSEAKGLLLFSLACLLLMHSSNVLEHGSVTTLLDPYEDCEAIPVIVSTISPICFERWPSELISR